MSVDLLRSSHRDTPVDEMILEDAFVQLVKDVGREASKYVRVGKVFPEWVVYMSEALFSECCDTAAAFL